MKNNNSISIEEQIIESLEWRYATKKFDPSRNIPESDMNVLLKALQLAPSSMGLQPYRFLRITDADTRKALKEASMNQSQITDAAELIVFTAMEQYTEGDIDAFLRVGQERRQYSDEAIAKRKASISKYVNGFSPEKALEWHARQLYIAMGQLLTVAAMLGIDACPMEGIKADAYAEILDLQNKGLRAFAVVTLGYRSTDDSLAQEPKIRMPLSTLLKEV